MSSEVWYDRGSARAAIGATIGRSVDELDGELPRARAGVDPEGVHQARVATRRLRSDLRTFGPLLDEEWLTEIRSELQWLADALGEVRDADVLELHLGVALEDVGVDADNGAPVLEVLRHQQRAARHALVRVLDDPRTEALVAELRQRADDPPTTPSALGRADRRMRPLVRRPWRKLQRAVDALGDQPSVAELHRVRLLAKRARYAAEAVVPVFGSDARRFAKAVKGVQDVLGDMNDAQVAIHWLTDVAAELDPASAFVAGRLAQHFRTEADVHHQHWRRSFERARKRSGWLA